MVTTNLQVFGGRESAKVLKRKGAERNLRLRSTSSTRNNTEPVGAAERIDHCGPPCAFPRGLTIDSSSHTIAERPNGRERGFSDPHHVPRFPRTKRGVPGIRRGPGRRHALYLD